jgi:hypothetical protein
MGTPRTHLAIRLFRRTTGSAVTTESRSGCQSWWKSLGTGWIGGRILMRMGPDKGDEVPKDWGAEEVHDPGSPSPTISPSQNVPRGIASVSDASGGGIGISPLLFEPANSTPLESDEPELTMPTAALWAMEDRKHSSWRPAPGEDQEIRYRVGSGDRTLYAIDDGPHHCMIGRLVGEDADGCVYCLVARIDLDHFNDLKHEDVPLERAFTGARDISLSSVFESESVSNVVQIQHYRRDEDVPDEYLPPSPFLEFT